MKFPFQKKLNLSKQKKPRVFESWFFCSQKLVSGITLFSLVLSLITPGFLYPLKVKATVLIDPLAGVTLDGKTLGSGAGVGEPVSDVWLQNLQESTKLEIGNVYYREVGERLQDKAKQSAWAIAFKQGLHYLLNTFAQDVATWLASGGEGQQPMFFTDGWGDYLIGLADGAAGSFLERLGKDWLDGLNICNPSNLSLKIGLGLGIANINRPRQPNCTVSEMVENWDTLINDPNFLDRFQVAFSPEQNDISLAFKVFNKNFSEIELAKMVGIKEREVSEFKAKVEKISKKILTPVPLVHEEAAELIRKGNFESEKVTTGDIVADAINNFVQTLAGSLFQRLFKEGLASLHGDDSSSSDSNQGFSGLSGLFDLYSGDSGQSEYEGAELAEERFSTFLDAGIVTGGPYKILQQLTICSDMENPGPEECVIDHKFRLAIEKEMTVREAIEAGHLDGKKPFGFIDKDFEPLYNEGYPYRSLLILRAHRIIPVTWEIAAQAIAAGFDEKDTARIYSLNDLIGKFNDSSSIFYHLIDENWVLKAPEHFCAKEGYGPKIVSESRSGDTQTVNRATYCADYRSCIDEDVDGSCRFYGYCVEEKPVWNLQGIECLEEYNTCQTFQNSQGQIASYLKNSLDFNGCSVDNAGCQWFCQEYNVVNDVWTCVYEAEKVLKPCIQVGGCPRTANCEIALEEDFCSDLINGTSITISEPCSSGSKWWDGAEEECAVTTSCEIPQYGVSCTETGCESLANLLPNHDFEIGAGLGILAQNWTGDSTYFERVSGANEKVIGGSGNSVRLYNAGTTISESMTSESIDLSGGTGDYTFSGFIYNRLNSGSITITVNGVSKEFQSDIKNQWQRISFDFPSAASVAVQVTVDGLVSGRAWFDEFRISESCIVNPITLTLDGDIEKDESKLHLDRDAQACSAEDDGCSEFIRLKENLGTNIIPNSSFEIWPNALASPEGWRSALGGEASQNTDEVAAGTLSLALVNGQRIKTENLFAMRAGTDYYLSFWAKANIDEEASEIEDAFKVNLEWDTPAGSDSAFFEFNGDEEPGLTSDWQWFVSDTMSDAFEDETLGFNFGTDFVLDITNTSGQEILIDAIQLEPIGLDSSYSNYKDYGTTNLTYLNKPPGYLGCTGDYNNNPDECFNYALYCQADEVGCEAYEPLAGGYSIPAVVAWDDYCPAECVGYEAYKQSTTFFENIESLEYFVPYTADQCQAAEVGCTEFTNLDEVALGGEGKEYYQYLRLCQDPNEEGSTCKNFYTWQGSNETGFQLKVHSLVADSEGAPDLAIPDSESDRWPEYWGDPADCDEVGDLETNPFCREFYDLDENTYYELYANTKSCSDDCHPFRKTRIVEDSTDAQANCEHSSGTWNVTSDVCIYNAIPGQGIACSASGAGCREYRGNAGANIYTAFFESFEPGDRAGWHHGEISSEALSVGGHSLKSQTAEIIDTNFSNKRVTTTYGDLGTNCSDSLNNCDDEATSGCYDPDLNRCVALDSITGEACLVNFGEQYCGILNNIIKPNTTYLISFWAKSADGSVAENITVQLAKALGSVVAVTNFKADWDYYLFGPFTTQEEIASDVRLRIFGPKWNTISGTVEEDFYVDNIEIKEVHDYVYVKANSWNTPKSCDTNFYLNPPESAPQFMLGCAQYSDSYGRVHNLKSFNHLCREEAVGCEAMIDTFNSTSPFVQTENIGDIVDDVDYSVTIPADDLVYIVNRPEYQCNATAKGCQAVGIPVINYTELDPVVSGYGTVYLINNPDQYSAALCQHSEVGCAEFQTSSGSAYFKDPGRQTCEYRVDPNPLVQEYGWFKTGSTSDDADCPITEPLLGANHPSSGYAGLCPGEYNTCSQFVDPISDISKNLIYNGDLDQYLGNPDIPDGWTPLGSDISQDLNLQPGFLYTLSVNGNNDSQIQITNCTGITSFDNSFIVDNDTATLTLGAEDQDYSARFSIDNDFECVLRINGFEKLNNPNKIAVRETGIYYTLANSVDRFGCNGLVNPQRGCVLFNNRGNIDYSVGEEDTTYLTFDADVSGPELNGGIPVSDCFGTCDSDTILRVRPDRECGEWLSCSSRVEEINDQGQEQEICLGLQACNLLADNGSCERVKIYENLENRTFLSPSEIDLAKNYSGYSNVGVNFSALPDIEGYYPYHLMQEVGESASVPNGNFESVYPGTTQPIGWGVADTTDNKDWTSGKFEVQTDVKYRKQDVSYLKLSANHKIKTETIDIVGSVFGGSSTTPPPTKYTLLAWVNTLDLEPARSIEDTSASARILIQTEDEDGDNGDFCAESGNNCEESGMADFPNWVFLEGLEVKAGKDWTKVSVDVFIPSSVRKIKLLLTNYSNEPTDYCNDTEISPNPTVCALSGHSLFDDITMKSILKANDATMISRSCRIYPSSDALSCNFWRDDNLYVGQSGYCLLRDSRNQNICLQWWPVDQIKGEVLDEISGYDGRIPLYQCLEGEIKTDFGFSRVKISDHFRFGDEITPGQSVNYPLTNNNSRVVLAACHIWIDGHEESSELNYSSSYNTVDLSSGVFDGLVKDLASSFIGGDLGIILGGLKLFISCGVVQDFTLFSGEGDPDGGPDGDDIEEIIWYIIKTVSPVKFLDNPLESLNVMCVQGGGGDPNCEYNPILLLTWGFTKIWGECTKVVQTVNSVGNNKAWLSRVRGGTDYKLDWLNYNYDAVYAPFGSMMALPGQPESWYQFIDGHGTGPALFTYLDLVNRTYDQANGTPYKITDTDNNLYYSALFGQCTESQVICLSDKILHYYSIPPCPLASEECLLLKDRGETDYRWPAELTGEGDPPNPTAIEITKNVYAQSFDMWEWDNDEKEYESFDGGWNLPADECSASGSPVSERPTPGSTEEALLADPYCYITPVIYSPSLEPDMSVEPMDGHGTVRLDFNIKVDPDQLPLRFYRLDWGDGSASSVSGANLRNRVNPDNPFQFYHLYDYWQMVKANIEELTTVPPGERMFCDGDAYESGTIPAGECWTKIKINIEDNWFISSVGVESDWVKVNNRY